MHKQPITIEKYRQEVHGSDYTETSGTALQALRHKQPIPNEKLQAREAS